jgi:hypothetical protein
MKNTYKLAGIAAVALAIVFSFAACNTGTSSGGDPTSATYTATDGLRTYKLTVSRPGRAAYTPEDGDSYVLSLYMGRSVIESEMGRITGTITGSGGNFTLNGTGTDSNKVTISDGKMTAITNTITIEGINYTINYPVGKLIPVTGGSDTWTKVNNWGDELDGVWWGSATTVKTVRESYDTDLSNLCGTGAMVADYHHDIMDIDNDAKTIEGEQGRRRAFYRGTVSANWEKITEWEENGFDISRFEESDHSVTLISPAIYSGSLSSFIFAGHFPNGLYINQDKTKLRQPGSPEMIHIKQ